jgi:hypothetical protein
MAAAAGAGHVPRAVADDDDDDAVELDDASGHLYSQPHPRESLSTLVLSREWLKDLLSVVKAPEDLMDIETWALSFGVGDDVE